MSVSFFGCGKDKSFEEVWEIQETENVEVVGEETEETDEECEEIVKEEEIENFQLKPNEKLNTSNWQTYKNDEFGFEVEYTRGWNVKKKEREYYTYFMFGVNTGNYCSLVYVRVHDLPKENMTLDELLETKTDKSDYVKYKFENSKKVNINNQEFIISDIYPDFLNAVTVKNNKYYIIEMGDDTGGITITNECRNYYYNVLDSFKFTK